jgi:chromosomal replication initiator protein
MTRHFMAHRVLLMVTSDPALWRDVLAYLRRHHGPICRQWFEELEPLSLEGGVLHIRTNTTIQRNYLSRHCTTEFQEAAQAVTGALVAVRFVDDADAVPTVTVRKGSGDNGSGSNGREHRPTLGGEDEMVLSPDYTFEHFVTGPGNRLAAAASRAVADQPGRAYNPLFIHGGVGLGKTHLLQAICHTVLTNQPDAAICYLSCDTFVNQFLDCVQGGKMNQFRHRYRHVDMLIIDDIHFLADRERTQEEFFHTFNTLYQTSKQIVLSSDSPPNEIPQLEERLVSRFNWGLVTRIDMPCYETRVAIVKKKAALRGVEMPGDVICYIASKVESNTRELEGAITKTQSLAMLNGCAITLELAQEALGDEPTAAAEPQLSIQTIIDAVTDFYGVKLSDLQSKRRHRSITLPRQVCMYLARRRTAYSLEEIGGYFGGRDHTTVMHAIRTIKDRVELDPQLAGQVNQLDHLLAQ